MMMVARRGMGLSAVGSWLLVVALAACAGAEADRPAPSDTRPELDLSMRMQIARMEAQALTSADLLDGYLARIAARDGGPFGIHAMLSLDPRARAVAVAVDAKRGSGARLQGAVIALKDNIDTAGLATTAGSLALVDNVPAADAPLVARLRAANAVIVGKTNLSEWANFRGAPSESGWSALGGQTRNAKRFLHNPCGSSAGSGAAMAAHLVSATLGSETDGSIVCPASMNGVVGFKPTVGLVSRTGVIPISSTLDTVGPITHDVGDAARILSVIAGPDPADHATSLIPPGLSLDFEAGLATATVAGKRLGVVRVSPSYGGPTQARFDAQLAKLAAAGAILVDVVLEDEPALRVDELLLMLVEFRAGLDAYLARHARVGQPGSLAEVTAFNLLMAPIELKHFGQELFWRALAAVTPEDPTYLAAKQRARARSLAILGAPMVAHQLDALVSVTASPTWITNYNPATSMDRTYVFSQLPAVAGAPHLTVPMGDVDGLPVGFSIFALPWQDAKVLALGAAYERVRDAP